MKGPLPLVLYNLVTSGPGGGGGLNTHRSRLLKNSLSQFFLFLKIKLKMEEGGELSLHPPQASRG